MNSDAPIAEAPDIMPPIAPTGETMLDDILTGLAVLVFIVVVPLVVWAATRKRKYKDPHTENWREPW